MGIKERISRLFTTKQPSINYTTGMTWGIPPEQNTESLLNAYKTVSTLHASISRIANAVGEAKWRLYEVAKSGKRKEITDHPLLTMLHYVNPFQTGNELFEMTQMHLDITGRAFWVLNYNNAKKPAEIWIAEPHKMTIVPDPVKFISHYEYKNGTNVQKLPTENVIYFNLPDPANLYSGASPTQASSVDISIERYTRRWQERFFYNNAEPQGIVTIPGIDEEDLKRFEEEWKKKYRGLVGAHRLAFLNTEAKYERTGSTQKEMDFWRSDKANRDRLLLGLGMPLSVMGISENVNRANAEAGEFLFTRWVVRPRLVRIREKLNEQLAPKFGKGIELDFDEPVPETKEMQIQIAESGVRSGFLTINEARKSLGFDPIPSGNVLLIPLNMIAQPITGDLVKPSLPPKEEPAEEPIPPKSKIVKNLFKEERDKEAYWKAYAGRAEQWEEKLILDLKEMFRRQEERVLAKLNPNADVNKLLNLREAKKEYKKATEETLLASLSESVNGGQNLVNPENPHKQISGEEYVNEEALKWLKTRIGWAAEEVSETTSEMLSSALAAGFEAGESMDEIAERVKQVFDICSDSRALKIARTEIIMASNEGALLGYEESGW